MQIQEASRPQVGGSWCGTSWGPSIYYSETKSITLIIRVLHLFKEQDNYNFDFRIAYKVLRKEYATVRFGGTPPLGMFHNKRYITEAFITNPAKKTRRKNIQ